MKKSKCNIYKKAHPYTISTYLSRFTYLLILPLLQYLLFAPQSIAEIIGAVGVNILFVLCLVLAAVLEYRSIFYRVLRRGIYLRRGWFARRSAHVPQRCVQSVLVQKNIIPGLFGAQKLHIDTPGSIKNKSDVSLVLSYKQTGRALGILYPQTGVSYVYKSSLLRILLMAATWSNSFTGLLLFAPFVKRVGTILGQEFSEKLYEGVNLGVYIASIGLPPVAAYIAGILVFGYFVAYIVQVARYARFSVEKRQNLLLIRRGLISRSLFVTEVEKINALSGRQSILMLLLRLKSVYIHTIGSGKAKGDKSLLLPAQDKQSLERALANLSGRTLNFTIGIQPPPKRLKNFLYLPLFCLLSVAPAAFLLNALGLFSQILLLLLLFCIPALLMWTAFRVVAFKKTALSYNDKAVMLRGFTRMNITENAVPFEKIQYIQIRQSIFQRRTESCNVKVYIFSESRHAFTVKNLDYAQALQAVQKIEERLFKAVKGTPE